VVGVVEIKVNLVIVPPGFHEPVVVNVLAGECNVGLVSIARSRSSTPVSSSGFALVAAASIFCPTALTLQGRR
ncbi:MAG: hypothetical protein WB735_12055, partial [Pseudonocardiaceae bacterium]